MTASPKPRLSHVGIYVRDLPAIERFYTQVMSLVVSDRGRGKNFQRDIVFLTGSASDHHQLVIASGRDAGTPSSVFQLSFKLDSLDALRAIRARALASGATDLKPMNHGNAWSLYFFDPEGNYVEAYVDTPFHIPQPHGDPLDLDQPDDVILGETERIARQDPGFMPRSEYVAMMERKLVD